MPAIPVQSVVTRTVLLRFSNQMLRMVAGDEGYGRREPAERLTRRLGRLPEEVRLLQSSSTVCWVGVRCDQQSKPGPAGLW